MPVHAIDSFPSRFARASLWEHSAEAATPPALILPARTLHLQTHNGTHIVGLYRDTACTLPATTAGDIVMGWKDELGTSGLIATQSDWTLAPTLQFSDRAVPVLHFDGVNDFMTVTVPAVAQPYTISARLAAWGANQAVAVDAGPKLGVGAAQNFFLASGSTLSGGDNTATPLQTFGRTDGLSTHTITGRFNGTGSSISLDGTQLAAGSAGTTGFGTALRIGSDSGGSNFFCGDLLSLIVAPTIGDTAFSQIVTYQNGLGDAREVELQTGTIDGQAYEILHPLKSNGTLVLYCHGASNHLRASEGQRPLNTAMLEAGYTLAETNAGGSNWGNELAVTSNVALVAYIRANFGTVKTVLLGVSMGGLVSLSLAKRASFTNIAGWFGIYPVCNLANMFAGSFHDEIKGAYGIADGDADYSSKTTGHDPALFSGSDFAGLRMRFYASPTDGLVDKTPNSDTMAALVASNAKEATVVPCIGSHGHASHYKPNDVLAFLARCVAQSDALVPLIADTGWTANSTVGDKTTSLATYSNGLNGTMVTALNLVSANTGTALSAAMDVIVNLVNKVAAMETSLATGKFPNR